ncbi:MAG: molybdopterin cofactor-binding domain-containing protein [Hyphomicrobiaceae bacterium]
MTDSMISANPLAIDRRRFLAGSAAAGAGFALGFHLPGIDPAEAQKAGSVPEVNAWVVIHPDDTVVVRIARSEMGQGTLTGLAQLVADELDCDWSKVTTEYPTPGENHRRKRVWGDMSTGGSRGLRQSVTYVRQGGATARAMLIAAAAKRWGVPAGECTAADSVVAHKASGKTLRYGELAAEAAKMPVPTGVKVKPQSAWKIIGKPVKRLDTAEKLNGKQIYGTDLAMPGMLSAAIKACPVFGGKLKSFDADKIKAMPGVRHVLKVGDNAVAVVATGWWQAKTALDKLPITWDEGPNAKVSSASIADFLKEGLTAKDVIVAAKKGDVAAAAKAGKTIEATYDTPFLHHVTMEPMNCTAKVTADRCEVWVPTQNGEAALAAAVKASGLPIDKCEVYKLHLGGGFGRRGAFQDYVTQAVLLAKQLPGTPVKLVWSREEDMAHGFYRPITMCKLTGSLDKDGNLAGLHMRLSGMSILHQHFSHRLSGGMDRLFFQGLLGDELGYDIPNLLVDHALRQTHVPVGFWRGVNHNQNAVYKECFLDELAHLAGKDPVDFRRKLLAKAPKHLAVLEAAVKKAEWGKPLPAGVHRGVCVQAGFGSYAAAIAEVSVSARGRLKVHRVVCAIDCGTACNPDQIAAQTEGAIAYGLHATIYGENTIKAGRVVEGNFDTYEMMRIDEMPHVDTVLVPSGGFWGGIGEPLTPLLAPAVLNGIFAATGKRVRTLPLKNVDLKRA